MFSEVSSLAVAAGLPGLPFLGLLTTKWCEVFIKVSFDIGMIGHQVFVQNVM